MAQQLRYCVDVCALHPQPTRCCMSQIVETKINDFNGLTNSAKCSAHLIVGNVWKEFVCGFRVGIKRQRTYSCLRSLIEIHNAALAIFGLREHDSVVDEIQIQPAKP